MLGTWARNCRRFTRQGVFCWRVESALCFGDVNSCSTSNDAAANLHSAPSSGALFASLLDFRGASSSTVESTDSSGLLNIQPLEESLEGRSSKKDQRRHDSMNLPIAGAKLPRVIATESPAARLLGDQAEELMRRLQESSQSKSIGAIASQAIQAVRTLEIGQEPEEDSSRSAEQFDQLLEEWESLLDEEDYEGVMQFLGRELGRDPEDVLATLAGVDMEVLREKENARRKALERELKEQIARKRVRMVDELGRAYATGKRKTSIARVWLSEPPEYREGLGRIRVNGRPFDEYFRPVLTRMQVMSPFEVTSTVGHFDVKTIVHGGGFTGQAQALRHGISKALQCWDPELRPQLKAHGFLTRDARIVERKKPGRAKARKSFQWVKR